MGISASPLILYFRHRGLGRRQAGDRYSVRGARDVVQSRLVEERYALRVAAVLAADAQFEVGVGLAALLAGERNQPADALPVDGFEGIPREDALFEVGGEKTALGVVAGEPAGRLGKIVGPEGEEVSAASYLAGRGAGAGQLYHGAD